MFIFKMWLMVAAIAMAEGDIKSGTTISESESALSGESPALEETQIVQPEITPPPKKYSKFQSTSSGAVYKRLRDEKFGSAWRDPSLMVWSDRITRSHGKGLCQKSLNEKCSMNHIQARKYCRSVGGTLPHKRDFIRLRVTMGAAKDVPEFDVPRGYRPQIFPDWDDYYWVEDLHSMGAYAFNGQTGSFDAHYRDTDYHPVRCVHR